MVYTYVTLFYSAVMIFALMLSLSEIDLLLCIEDYLKVLKFNSSEAHRK